MRFKNIAMLFLMVCLSIGAALAGSEHDATGTINSVDKVSKTLNISHDPIKTMGMMGMTMDFRVADPAMLDNVKPGQKIKFVITADRHGRFVVVGIE